MKVILVHKFWRKVGGAEVYFQDTARILREHGHEIRIFTTDYEAAESKDIYERTPEVIFGTSPEYLRGSVLNKIKAIPESIYSFKNKKQFKQLLNDFKPDIVHVFALYISITPSILDACRESGVPVVMSCNDYKHICPNYRLYHHGAECNDCKGGKFYKAFTNNCCKHSRAVSAVSAMEAYVHEWLNIYRKNISTFLFESRFMMKKTKEFWHDKQVDLRYLGKPFDASRFTPEYAYDNYLLFLGRLSDEKGVDVLIAAMRMVPEAHLKIAGDGPMRAILEKQAAQFEVKNIEFLGSIWGEATANVLARCRFVVIPSLWNENFPYVMTEAFSRGKAVIGSDKGGIPEYIQEGVTGLVYRSNDATQLANCIRELWNNPGQTVEMGKNARQMALSEFRDEVFYQRLSDIYQKVRGSFGEKLQF